MRQQRQIDANFCRKKLNELIFKRNLLSKWVEQNEKVVGLHFIIDAIVDSKTDFNPISNI